MNKDRYHFVASVYFFSYPGGAREILESLFFDWLTWQLAIINGLIDHNLSIDNEIFNPDAVPMWLAKGCLVCQRLGIEDHDISHKTFFYSAPVKRTTHG